MCDSHFIFFYNSFHESCETGRDKVETANMSLVLFRNWISLSLLYPYPLDISYIGCQVSRDANFLHICQTRWFIKFYLSWILFLFPSCSLRINITKKKAENIDKMNQHCKETEKERATWRNISLKVPS